MKKPFKKGSVVVFDPTSFNPDFWNKLSEADKIKYYGPIGYGAAKPKLYIYMSEILGAPDSVDGKQYSSGHCVLIDMDTGQNEIMRHSCDFRLATEDEF